MADLSDDLADLSLLARPATMTAGETVSLNRLFDSLHSAGQETGRAYAKQCQAVYLSEEDRKTKRDSDGTSPDLKAICGNAGDFYDCVVSSKGCAMSKGGYLCVKNNRHHPTHSYSGFNPATTQHTHSGTVTFVNKAGKILQEDGIDLFVDGGMRVAELLNASHFDLSTPNSAINSTKSPEKRALDKAAKLRSEEKKLERKMRVKAEQMRLQAAAAEEPEVGHCCVT